jgi:glutamine amidotransferase
LLGICLGMQMLSTRSAEFGMHDGLGLIPGEVLHIPNVTADGQPQKTPHIGWAELAPGRDWKGTVFDGIPAPVSMYLVHSFTFHPTDRADLLATYVYGGHEITAAVQRGNVIGCQFHPEKSARAGLALLARFLEL